MAKPLSASKPSPHDEPTHLNAPTAEIEALPIAMGR